MQLKKKIIYQGNIILKTGLHIGDTNAQLGIGGIDKFVVRNPLTNIPYIPGSSLKGKMRCLTELYYGEANNGKPTCNPDSHAGSLFGTSADNNGGRPSRLIVRDCDLVTELDTDETLSPFGLSKEDVPDFSNTNLLYTESKTESSINRITAKSQPRTFERIPAGAQFKLEMVLNVFDNDDEEKLKSTLRKAMELLMDDYLGGNGSRGYGQIVINLVEKDGNEKSY